MIICKFAKAARIQTGCPDGALGGVCFVFLQTDCPDGAALTVDIGL
jgi:hypothetical protein